MKNRILVRSILSTLIFTTLFYTSCKKDDTNATTTVRGRGLVIDDNRYSSIPFGSPSFTGTIPDSFDLTPDMPPIGDQGMQGSCVAWSVGYCLKSYQEKIEHNYSYTGDDKLMSPAYIYNQIKVNTDCNSGSNFNDAFDLLQKQGVCNLSQMSYNSNDCSLRPNSFQNSSATLNKIESYKRVDISNLDQIKTYIYQKTPVVIGVAVDQEFNEAKPNSNGRFIWQGAASSLLGYHALVVIGYNNSINAFKIQNSWGASWANNGYAWIDYNKFLSAVKYAFVATDMKSNISGPRINISGSCPSQVKVGTSQSFDVTISNTGYGDLQVNSLNINSNTPNIFSVQNTSFTVHAGQLHTIQVTFSPTAVAQYYGSLEVKSNAVAGNDYLSLSGAGSGTASSGCINQVEIIANSLFRDFRVKILNGSSYTNVGPTVFLNGMGDSTAVYNLDNGVYVVEARYMSSEVDPSKTLSFRVSNCVADVKRLIFY